MGENGKKNIYPMRKGVTTTLMRYGTVKELHFSLSLSLLCFSGMVTAADEALGSIIHALRLNGLYSNTIIIFTSDASTYYIMSPHAKLICPIIR